MFFYYSRSTPVQCSLQTELT